MRTLLYSFKSPISFDKITDLASPRLLVSASPPVSVIGHGGAFVREVVNDVKLCFGLASI